MRHSIFFVTAEHIVDWIHPDNKANREVLRSSMPLLRITSHIANGAKHFEAKAKHHKSVNGVLKSRYVAVGYVEEGYFQDPLLVHLTPEEANAIDAPIAVEAVWLARRVLEYWIAYLD